MQVGGGSAAARGRERAGATGRRRARLPFLLRGQWCRGWFWLHTHTCADDSVGPLPSQATWASFQIGVGDCTTYGRSLHRGSRPPLSPPSLSLALVMARDYGQIFAHRGPFSDRFSAGSVRKPSETRGVLPGSFAFNIQEFVTHHKSNRRTSLSELSCDEDSLTHFFEFFLPLALPPEDFFLALVCGT